jgi:ABC-type transport system involved in multi-copper enzyme maturation permease subunit
MGIDVSEGVAPRLLLVVVWSHPIVLAIVWGFEVVLGTRVPAGEIESGTIDVLLGWPVSRSAVYVSETLVWLSFGVGLLACGWLGFELSAATLPAELRPERLNTLLILANLFAVYLAVGGTVQCIAAGCDRRGKAMSIALAFLLASFLLQFLSTLWSPAERVVALSFAHYYQPARVMMSGELPGGDILVLLVWGTVLWGVGLLVWRRRSVLTV